MVTTIKRITVLVFTALFLFFEASVLRGDRNDQRESDSIRAVIGPLNKKPPWGIYLVAIAFFVGGLICMAALLSVIFPALGIEEGLNLATIKWVVTGYLLAFCLVCYGVALLTRLHPAPQWLMFGMTLFLMFQTIAAPAGDSPFYSAPRIYLNRFLLVLPMIASCVYLLRPRFRAACREFRRG